MKKLCVALFGLVWAMGAMNAHAQISVTINGLEEVDDPVFGEDAINIDLSTGLEWLDLSRNTGLSFDELVDELGVGGSLEGFRPALPTEVTTLISDIGYPLRSDAISEIGSTSSITLSDSSSSGIPENIALLAEFLEIFGYDVEGAGGGGGVSGILSDDVTLNTFSNNLIDTDFIQLNFNFSDVRSSVNYGEASIPSGRMNNWWLVRDTGSGGGVIDPVITIPPGLNAPIPVDGSGSGGSIIGDLQNGVVTLDDRLRAIEVGQVGTVDPQARSMAATNTLAISDLSDRVDDNEQTLTSHDGRISQNEQDIQSLDGRVTTNEQTLVDHETRISDNEEAISGNTTAIASNSVAINTVQSQANSNTQGITANSQAISVVDTRSLTNSSAVVSLMDGHNVQAAQIEALAASVEQNRQQILAVERILSDKIDRSAALSSALSVPPPGPGANYRVGVELGHSGAAQAAGVNFSARKGKFDFGAAGAFTASQAAAKASAGFSW